MFEQSTINKLIEMRLTSMANALIIQSEAQKLKDVSFEDRLVMLQVARATVLSD